jgi:prolyl-tRNA synthetase
LEVARRDELTKEIVSIDKVEAYVENLLTEIQSNLYKKALNFREENTVEVNTWEEFIHRLDNEGGFVSAHWDGTPETEEKIKQESKATIRCIPLDNKLEEGKCILTGKPSKQRVLFARAY